MEIPGRMDVGSFFAGVFVSKVYLTGMYQLLLPSFKSGEDLIGRTLHSRLYTDSS